MRAFYFFRFPDVAEAAKIAAGLAATNVPCVFAPGDQTTMLFAAAYECLCCLLGRCGIAVNWARLGYGS
jgi:hypothetical protein